MPALPTLLPRVSPVSRLKAKCGISLTAVWSVLACADLCLATDAYDVAVVREGPPSFFSVFPSWMVTRHMAVPLVRGAVLVLLSPPLPSVFLTALTNAP